MAACGSLRHIFESPLAESTQKTILDHHESLSPWNHHHIEAMKAIDDGSSSCLTELFSHGGGDENQYSSSSTTPQPSSPRGFSSWSSSLSSSPFSDAYGIESLDNNNKKSSNYRETRRKESKDSDSFSCISSESLSLCTEGLGFESSDEVEDITNDVSVNSRRQQRAEKRSVTRHRGRDNLCSNEYNRSRVSSCRGSSYPPPISSIGRDGKPLVNFQSYREDGRFILKEIRFPAQEFLHSCREHGRLTMQFVPSDDEMFEDDDDDDDDDEEGNGGAVDDDDHEHGKNADQEEEEKEAENDV